MLSSVVPLTAASVIRNLVQGVDGDVEARLVSRLHGVEGRRQAPQDVPRVAREAASHAQRELVQGLEDAAEVLWGMAVEEHAEERRLGRGEIRVDGAIDRLFGRRARRHPHAVQSIEDRRERELRLGARLRTRALEARTRETGHAVATLDVPAEPVDVVEQAARQIEAAAAQLDAMIGHRRQRALNRGIGGGNPHVLAGGAAPDGEEHAVGSLVDAREPARHDVVVLAVAAQESAPRDAARGDHAPLEHGHVRKARPSLGHVVAGPPAEPLDERALLVAGEVGGQRTVRRADRRTPA